MSPGRLIIVSLYTGIAFLFGLGLGVRGELGFVQHIFTVVVPLATLILAIYAKRGRLKVGLTGVAMLGGLLLGQVQFERGWQDCIVRGERVRDALLDHSNTSGFYPSRLEDLDIALPCRAGLRTTILHYISKGQSYHLWFSNDSERWAATERVPFRSIGRSAGRPDS
ncbi:MAG TPA: hypothetical protein VF701_13920 [Thermoanaerobaculia bacterium]